MRVEWVVRAGEAKAPDLVTGYTEHAQVSNLYGFSVQYQPGMSWQKLARAGQFPNAKVSIAYDTTLQQALKPLGYEMRLVMSPGKGHHHTFVVLYDVNGVAVKRLPNNVAKILHDTFGSVDILPQKESEKARRTR